MVGASADDAGPKPAEFVVFGDRIRLAFYVPISVRRVEVAPLLAAEVFFSMRSGAAMIHLVRQHVLLEILGRIKHRSGLEESHAHSEIGKDLDGCAASGAGADDNNVENLWTALDLEHVSLRISHIEAWGV